MSQEMMIQVLCGAVGVLLIVCIAVVARLVKLEKKLQGFMKGKDGGSLEEEISKLFEDSRHLSEEAEKAKNAITDIREQMKGAFQKSCVIKYDAFHQMGGNLSYVLCMLNEENDGFLLNSVHSVEGSYSYIKTVKAGESDLELGDEEREALQEALKKEVRQHNRETGTVRMI